jgi:hypothetical protein
MTEAKRRGRPPGAVKPLSERVTNAEKVARYKLGVAARYAAAAAEADSARGVVELLAARVGTAAKTAAGSADAVAQEAKDVDAGLARKLAAHRRQARAVDELLSELLVAVGRLVAASDAMLRAKGQAAGVAVSTATGEMSDAIRRADR